MSKVCRTCLQIINPNAPAYHLDTREPNSASIKNKLAGCVPELRLDVVTDPVLCCVCAAALNSAYEFKQLCLNTEDTIYGFLSKNGLDIVDDLNEVICKKSSNCETKSIGLEPDQKEEINTNDTFLSNETTNSREIIDNSNIKDKKFQENNGQIIVNQSEPEQSSVYSYKCKFCDYSTNKRHLIKLHMQTYNFKCIWCNYRTAKRGRFLTHINFHLRKKSLKCNYGSIFAHNLRRHLKARNGGKPYKWKLGPTNGSGFKRNGKRANKLFNCTLCSYSVAEGILLSKHMKNHTREMQFKCDSCGCAFTNRRMLVDHLRIHMSQRSEKQ